MIRVGIFIALTIQCGEKRIEHVIQRSLTGYNSEVFSRCNVGWIENKGFCYAFSAEALPWLQAASACQVYNARLVQIESQEKQDYIASQMAVANIDNLWTGGSCRYHSSYWEWVPSLKPMKAYTNWNTGEPNYPQSEQCLEIRKENQYRWNDMSCGTASRFACEKRTTSGPSDASSSK